MADTKVMKCVHCGKQSVFQVRSEGTRYGASLPKDLYNIDYDGITITTWRVLECALCFKPTIVQDTVEYWFDHGVYRAAEVQSAETIVLYPEPKRRTPLTNLPEAIEKEYEATLRVQDISSNACAVLARRTLEAIFTHQGATGGSLYQKVDSLLKSTSIPPLLADIAHLGRQIGNLGAHFEKGEATDEDVAVMLDFLETILEYLYVIPAKVTLVKARLNQVS